MPANCKSECNGCYRWIEHDPYVLLKSVNTCIAKACEQFVDKGYVLDDIKAVGVTNQRETTVQYLLASSAQPAAN